MVLITISQNLPRKGSGVGVREEDENCKNLIGLSYDKGFFEKKISEALRKNIPPLGYKLSANISS